MDIIPTPLIETGENEAVPEEKTPVQMAQEAHESASVGWVKREISISDDKHRKTCPAIRGMRTLRAYILVGLGFVLAASILGTWTIQASMRADRLELKDEFRSILREEIGKVAINEPAPSPLIYPPVTPSLSPSAKPRRATASTLPTSGARWLNPLNYVQAAQ